jgi:hypothetical protein
MGSGPLDCAAPHVSHAGALMVPLGLLCLLVLSLSHWMFAPALWLLTPLLSLTWLGWLALALMLWLFSGSDSGEPPTDRRS